MKAVKLPGAGTVTVPDGFSGFWCVRCSKERRPHNPEADPPARCPVCHKFTVFWIPEAEPAATPPWEPEPRPPRKYTKPGSMAEMFDYMRAVVDEEPDNDGTPNPS